MNIIRDAIHGNITISKEEREVIDTSVVQRLRYIKQLGFASMVFPSAVHTRFEHSLGAMHLAKRVGEKLELSAKDVQTLKYAAILHDIGHGPFSHTSEEIIETYSNIHHEEITTQKIRLPEVTKVLEKHGVDPELLVSIISGEEGSYKTSIISSELDVDIMDYLLRDSYYTGVALGVVDIDMLIDCITLHNNKIVLTERGIHTAENFLVARYLMWPVAYLHRTECIADKMFVRAVSDALEKGTLDADAFYNMDDMEVSVHLKKQNNYAGDMMRQLYSRNLFKTIVRLQKKDIDREFLEQLLTIRSNPRKHIEIENEIARDLGIDPGYVILDVQKPPQSDVRDSPRVLPEIYIKTDDEIVRIDKISRLAQSLSEATWDHWFSSIYVPQSIYSQLDPEYVFSLLRQYIE